MIGSPHRRSRTGLWYAAFAIVSLLLLLASQTDAARMVQRASARALDPLRQSVASIGQGISGVFGTIGEIDRLRTENEELRRQLAGAEQRIAELDEAAAENEELRRLLGLTESLDMDLLPVRIISRDPSNFTWEVGIDAGSDDGLAEGMPVVGAAEGGGVEGSGALAGTVVDTGPDTATVRLIVDTRSSVVALDQQTRALGLVQGQLGGQLVMVQVNITDEVASGDSIISAGLELSDQAARSPFPKGLLIGQVQAVEPDENALTQTAFLHAAIDFTRVERLLVVLSFRQD
jgi:rod shape-determining protein MreC